MRWAFTVRVVQIEHLDYTGQVVNYRKYHIASTRSAFVSGAIAETIRFRYSLC